ncbi:hypothetical protein MesoLj113c_43830 [Mesorhizobium sp. 113-3-9]|uniref:hypothetical protein n=1 Tax=Mesorhizobium sp. 113-3-9 TaxID=2744517 RepID=UPI001928529B|nr:hypothetical protein [Mesorhizobium sp. 113-3-9]BCG88273.1 hypothetical protein MesoLj113c_43830 [Mesorhizobium sp. 113-3-9]
MIRKPFPAEWDTSQMPKRRRAYLEIGLSFEEMVDQIQDNSDVVHVKTKPYCHPARGEPRTARQIVFRVRIGNQASDLLYNSRDGLRGRYWQSPEHGFVATHHLIRSLTPALLSFSERNPPKPEKEVHGMTIGHIRWSLAAPSAKVWPRERDSNDNSLLEADALQITRWITNEGRAEHNQGMWRQTPMGDELEIKGGLLGIDGTEYLPEGKRSRSWQIHEFGYT